VATEHKDVLRHEDTTAALPSSSRNMQTTYETDLQKRQRHALATGEACHWTPDEKFTSEIPSYSNGALPWVANVKQALDLLVLNSGTSGIIEAAAGVTVKTKWYQPSNNEVYLYKSTDGGINWVNTGFGASDI
jgi:hypothetical protein